MKEQGKVLVAYASKYGATAGIAEAIADTLRQEGLEAEVRPARDIKDLGSYGAVVLGSPVYTGRWMSEVLDFVKRHRESLKGLPVAYFTVGILPRERSEEGQQVHDRVIEKARQLAPEVEPVAVGMFNGALDKSKLGFFIRTLMTLMRAQEGDFRDWEAIRSWAKTLSTRLLDSRC
jgi:menaquinone-dependent protoporphyrinogen oxidase